MRHILFVHHNFPGQFAHVARALARSGHWRVFAVGGEGARAPAVVTLETYAVAMADAASLPSVERRAVGELRRGQAAAEACLRLRQAGCDPAIVVGHAGWGELAFLRDVFPAARLVSYLEFFFTFEGADVNFDPAFPDSGLRAMARVRARNAPSLAAALDSDVLVTPTQWQASRFPPEIRRRLRILHEGIDTARAAPDPGVHLQVRDALVLGPQDEVVTYVARNLEPYRGFHVFMRALPAILAQRPHCHVVVIGGTDTSYGQPPKVGGSWKSVLLQELEGRIDLARVHFLGRVTHDVFLGAMQLSRAHVYLTYPFVLSWSLLEAMACGAPVVGSRTAPVQEVIEDGRTGRLVDFFDHDALARAVSEILADREAAAALGRAARQEVVERFDLRSRCLPAWLALVDELADGAGQDAANAPADFVQR